MDVESLSTCLSGINIIIENQLRYIRITLQGLEIYLQKIHEIAITLSHTHIQPSIDFCLTLISPIYPHHIEIDTSHNVRGELLSRYQKRKNLTF